MTFFNEHKKTNIDNEFNERKINFSFLQRLDKKKIIVISSTLLVMIIMVVIFLNKEKYYIELVGSEEIIVYKDSEYIELGYEVYDTKGNNYTDDVTVEGYVDTSIDGEYILTYKYKNIEKERTITVISTDNTSTFIVLKGEKTVHIKLGEIYIDSGCEVYDYEDKDINSKVETISTVNIHKAGTYKVIYRVENSSGIITTAERRVIVVDSNINLSYDNTKYVSDYAEINVYVNDNYFAYVLEPDGNINYERNYIYKATQNGTYTFREYSIDGTYKESSIYVDTIDNIAPTGTCSATVDTITKVTTNITDNKKIASYKYTINTDSSDYTSLPNYASNLLANKVVVEAKDAAGNVSKITCTLKIDTNIKSDSSINNSNSVYVAKEGLIPCNGDRTEYNNELNNILNKYGKRTRASAAAIARYISQEIDVKIPYFWAGGHWHYTWDGKNDVENFRGFSPQWGCITANMRAFNGTNMLPAGMDCTGFVAWVLFNTGFSKSEVGSWSGSTYITKLGGKTLSVVDFKGSTGKIKAGDIIWRQGHMGFISNVDGEIVTVAHAKGTAYGLVVEKYSSKTGKKIGGGASFSKVTILDNFYE